MNENRNYKNAKETLKAVAGRRKEKSVAGIVVGLVVMAVLVFGPLRVAGFAVVAGLVFCVVDLIRLKAFSKPALLKSWVLQSPGITDPAPPAWSLALLKRLDWRRFEELCAAYFEAEGYLSRFSDFGGDGGVDIYLYRTAEPDTLFGIVQCKAWSEQPVGVKEVREFFGVMHHLRCSLGLYMTIAGFTEDAKAFAKGKELDLVTGEQLLTLIKALPAEQQTSLLKLATRGDYTIPTCPSCGVTLVSRTAAKGGKVFWGCTNFPRCRYTMPQKSGNWC